MNRHKKKIIFLILAVVVSSFAIKLNFQNLVGNSLDLIESSDSNNKINTPTHRIPIKEIKKAAQRNQLNIKQNKRAPASVNPSLKITSLKKNEISDPSNRISKKVKNHLSKQFSKSLGSLASWKLSHVESTKRGHKVLVELKDNTTQKSSSYHALVEPSSGRILTTWHRQIHR